MMIAGSTEIGVVNWSETHELETIFIKCTDVLQNLWVPFLFSFR